MLVLINCFRLFVFIVIISPYSSQEAGIAPTSEQVEMFSYQLPKASLKKILVSFTFRAS